MPIEVRSFWYPAPVGPLSHCMAVCREKTLRGSLRWGADIETPRASGRVGIWEGCLPPQPTTGRWSGERPEPVPGRIPSRKRLFNTFWQWCGLRPSVLWQDRTSETKNIGLGLALAGLVLCCETRSCHARCHNDLEGHSNFSSRPTIYSFCILSLEHHYCGDQEWRLLTQKFKSVKCLCLFPSCYFGLGLKNLILFTSLIRVEEVSPLLDVDHADVSVHRCKNVFYVFYSGHVFYVFNVFLFFRFLFLKTFIENTIWNHFRNNGNKLGLYDCFSLCPC